jgi:dihydrofolate synthase/folylpolyglutamate synthase
MMDPVARYDDLQRQLATLIQTRPFSAAQTILRHHGLHTGLHLSPHIQIINERHQLDGQPAPTSALTACWPAVADAVQAAAGDTAFGVASYFETQLALSLHLFATRQVDVAVVEVGLGGTLDATNVLPARVAVLTNVGLDHTEILGDTPLKIARDKAGIFKPRQTVFSAVTQPDVRQHVQQRCDDVGATLHLLGESIQLRRCADGRFDVQLPGQQLGGLSVGMAGDFQAINAALALGAARAFLGRDLDPDAAQAALSGVQLPGRAEVVQQHPRVILDGAHNPDKIRGAADTVARTAGRRIAVVALKAGKDAGSILPIVDQHVDHVILTRFRDKGLWTCVPPEEMRAILPHAEVIEDPDEAVSAAIDQAGAADTVWITGSLYLIGDVRQRWFPIAARLAALERDAK